MKSQLLDEVIACLPAGKTHYRYFNGAYASRILSMLMPDQVDLHTVKQTRFKRLLEHKSVKPIVAHSGNGVLQRDALEASWHEPSQPFLLSVNRWGGRGERDWYQTSRGGENLVLQLNLPTQHQQHFTRWIDPSGDSTLNGVWSSHPVQTELDSSSFRETLAWSRIDLDFDTNEALIEEVQSDATRKVLRMAKRYQRCGCAACTERLKYVKWFQPYIKLWSEALLCATIEFIHYELGINRVFIHTARSGWRVKKMSKTWHAPRSLYSDLPKKFAFKQTYAAPEFLLQTRCYQKLIRKQPDIDFYQLSMNELKQTVSGGVSCLVA